MKRKPASIEPPASDSTAAAEVVAPQILDGARRILAVDKNKSAAKCIVCSGETSQGSADQLCWVCRRLKISAWRDVEPQMPAQE